MPPLRVFVADVDLYVGSNVGKYIANAVIGAASNGEEEEEEEDEDNPKPKGETYSVVGTLHDKGAAKPKWVDSIVDFQLKEDLRETLLGCDYVVWDITRFESQIDCAGWAVEMLREEIDDFEAPKTFVLLSTILTWGKTRPADLEDPEAVITEDEYKRRRPHDHFKAHIGCEKLAIKCGRKTDGKLNTYVVASGVPYGAGEGPLHELFKAAWHNAPALPVLGDGTNTVPAIHVLDLAACVVATLEAKPDTKYILGLDDSAATLGDITKTISDSLGTGKVAQVEPALGDRTLGMTQLEVDMLTANLRLDAVAIKEMGINYVAQGGLLEAIETVVGEYRETRRLTPLRVALLGPPCAGKTFFAEQMCAKYKLHHLHLQGVIDSTLGELTSAVARQDNAREDEELTPEETEAAETARTTLEELKGQLEENGGRYEEQQILAWFKAKLVSMPCRNQGFVLDGFPKTEASAKELFGSEEDPEALDPAVTPEFVFALDASDTFLNERAMGLPEAEVAGTHHDEAGMARRLAAYRAANTDDTTVLNYFDFNEIHPVHIDVEQNDGGEVIKAMVRTVGDAHNYGPTPEERAIQEAEESARKATEEEAQAVIRAASDAEAAAEHAASEAAWSKKLDEVQKQEAEALEASSIPLRNFLVNFVMPSLTEGLVEVCKTKPRDPVDYLAEYLFKNNPQIE